VCSIYTKDIPVSEVTYKYMTCTTTKLK